MKVARSRLTVAKLPLHRGRGRPRVRCDDRHKGGVKMRKEPRDEDAPGVEWHARGESA